VPLWVTETGLSTGGYDRYAFSPANQAAGVTAQYRAFAAMPDVKAVMFHTLLKPDGGPASRDAGYAVLNPDRTPKPAYCALGALRGANACP
jgi:hypothetical protein